MQLIIQVWPERHSIYVQRSHHLSPHLLPCHHASSHERAQLQLVVQLRAPVSWLQADMGGERASESASREDQHAGCEEISRRVGEREEESSIGCEYLSGWDIVCGWCKCSYYLPWDKRLGGSTAARDASLASITLREMHHSHKSLLRP